MEKTMTTNPGREGVTDALGLDPADAPRQDSMQLTDRAELQRALLVYGMAGALGAGQARGATGDLQG
jgi:hypothetical protein